MPSVKEYTVRLASLRNTRKLTKTMKMVSATKLRRATEALRYADGYAARLRRIVATVARNSEGLRPALMNPQGPVKQVLVLCMGSEKGLCGGFNNSLFRTLAPWIEDAVALGRGVDVSFFGRRVAMTYRNRVPSVRMTYEAAHGRPEYALAWRVALDVQHDFLSGRAQEVYMAYNRFIGPLTQRPTIERLLPFQCDEPEAAEAAAASQVDVLVEPKADDLLAAIVPQCVGFRVYVALLHSAAGEHGARMTAMDAATTNADSLIDRTTLLRNRARQAAITKELAEIISGAEALQG